MKKWARLLTHVALAVASAAAAFMVAVSPASAAALPIDPANGNWPQWTFHSWGNYDLVVDAYSSGGDGSPAQLYPRTGNSNQVWFQEGDAEAYLHPGYDRWLCLGRTATDWGAAVQVQNCNGGILQRWSVARYSAQYQTLLAWDNQGFCVDVPSSNFVTRQRLQMWGCNSSGAQIWPVARCHGDGCENQTPSSQDCRTAGTSIVRDVTEGDERVYLTWSRGCEAVWASGKRSPYASISGSIVVHRREPGWDYIIAVTAIPGSYVTTRMWGTSVGGRWFNGCLDRDGAPNHQLCTPDF